jgi:hypothetical protein
MIYNLFVDIWSFLSSNQGGITVVFVIVAGLWQYWRYIKEWNFQNYHKLIKELNQSDTEGENIKLYRQVAVVYELRNYPRYFPVSIRILQGWLNSRSEKLDDNFKDLFEEMKLSIEYMNKNFIYRLIHSYIYKNN